VRRRAGSRRTLRPPRRRRGRDEYFPKLGNGGYDVGHYALRVRYDPSTDRADRARDDRRERDPALSQFNLDFSGLKITALRAGGADATWRLDGGQSSS
jgi:hypothetical protein